MTVTDLLQNHRYIRVSHGDTWLVWDDDLERWIVYQKKYRRKTRKIYETIDEDIAVREFLNASGLNEDVSEVKS